MFKKRFITAALSAILAVSVLAGCGGSGDTEGSDASPAQSLQPQPRQGTAPQEKRIWQTPVLIPVMSQKKTAIRFTVHTKTSIAGMTP